MAEGNNKPITGVTAQAYARAVLGVIILSVCLSVCLSHVCFVK